MKFKKYLFILFGILLGIFFSYLFHLFLKKPPAIIKRGEEIIAPYYEKKSFTIPSELKVEKKVKEKKLKIPIIMYHYVEYITDINDLVKKRLDINPYTFEQELNSLKNNGWQTYFIKDIPDIISEKTKISSQSVVLTFDDGYEDFYSVVFPLLKKYQLKATIYLIYDFIGRKGFLTKQEVEEIVKSGLVEIGSHTLNHYYLKYLPTSTQRKQISESKKKIEDDFGIKVSTFAYPYGAFSQETINLVKEASYSAAVSVIRGAYQSKNNLFYLSRIRAGIFGNNISQLLEKYNK